MRLPQNHLFVALVIALLILYLYRIILYKINRYKCCGLNIYIERSISLARVIKAIGVFGFVACLLIMYLTNHGIRGIQTFDSSFRLLDMRFHYSIEDVKQTFEQLSEGGRIAYQKYLVLDFVFILFFFITMVTISDAISAPQNVRVILYVMCGLRALLDIAENILLLHMLGHYPVFCETLATICSWFTTFKFIMLYIWLLSILIHFVVDIVKPLTRFQ